MGGIGGVDPNVGLREGGTGQAPLLNPGQVIQGIAELVEGRLVLRVGPLSLALVGDAAITLQAGQRVRCEVVPADEGLQIRLLPLDTLPPPPAAPADPMSDAVTPVILSILEQLDAVEVAPRVAQLLPPQLPPTQTAVRLVLSLFLTEASVGEDLGLLLRVTTEAASQGALAVQDAESFASLVRQWLPSDAAWQTGGALPVTMAGFEEAIQRCLSAASFVPPPEVAMRDFPEAGVLAGIIARFLESEPEFLQPSTVTHPETLAVAIRAFLAAQAATPQGGSLISQGVDADGLARIIRQIVNGLDPATVGVVRSAAERTAQPIEARLAAALASGRLEAVVAEIVEDVRTGIERLRQNDGFLGFLRQTGQRGSFEQAAQRVLDRQTAGELQNLRGQAAPYLFFEVPFPPTAPIRNAQVHLLGEGRGRKRRFDPQNTAVAIDLTTTRLGDLWISLAIHQGVCRCSIRARTPAIVRAIEAHVSELTERLGVAGYRAAQVRASLWDGDRISEAVGLFAQFAGVSVQA
jgi:hypothetical protein